MRAFRAYGTTLRTDVGLPGFIGADDSEASDAFRLGLPAAVAPGVGEVLRRRDEADNEDRLEVRRPTDDSLHLAFADGTRFLVDGGTRRIDGSWHDPLTFDDALVYLVGPVLGAAVRLARRSVLHASAIAIGGGATLLMGDAGAGKSTLTAAMLDRGAALVTEDVAALDIPAQGAPRVFRGGTRVKLWPESVAGLRGQHDALPLLVPQSVDWHKRFLDCSERMMSADALPVRCIVALERSTEVDSPQPVELRAHDKLLCLLANGYASRLMRHDDRADELERV
ncbi:MAG: hypothetical protein A2138_08395, partial [Deltaproteobacteria bacterium RBG_16_71_12]